MNLRLRQLGWVGVVCACALGLDARAQLRVEQAPVVLLLRSASDKETSRQEQRFFDELSLVLDDFAIFSQGPDEGGFFESSLTQQVASVERMAAENLAVAVVWLGPQGRERVAVHLVAANTGRTLVRTVEVKGKGKDKPQAVLALTVRELLGTAFLFEPEKARQTPAVKQVVETVRQEVVTLSSPAQPPPAPLPPPPATTFTIGGGPFLAQGLWGQVGPALRIGGRLAGDWGTRVWRAGLGVEASSWPGLTTESESVSGWEVAFGLEGAARWGSPSLRAGPTLGVHAVYENLSGFTSTGPQGLTSWKVRGLFGAAAAWQFSERWVLGLSARLELNQTQTQALRASDGSVVSQSPWGSLRFELTLTFI